MISEWYDFTHVPNQQNMLLTKAHLLYLARQMVDTTQHHDNVMKHIISSKLNLHKIYLDH